MLGREGHRREVHCRQGISPGAWGATSGPAGDKLSRHESMCLRVFSSVSFWPQWKRGTEAEGRREGDRRLMSAQPRCGRHTEVEISLGAEGCVADERR